MDVLRTNRFAAIAVVAIGLSGLIVAFQGWRARGPDEDGIGAIVRTVALVERGHIPQRGTLTDNLSFRPPGNSWVAIPGVLLFDDPRLVELTGSGLLYLGTLIGVFVLGRYYFGTSVALLATLLYAFSAEPLNLAATMQPRGHPFFCTWMIYCAARWIDDRNGRWLAASFLLWVAGMYIHLEMAPLLLVLPVLWWRFRPPVAIGSLAVAAVLALVMWSPYLVFQRDRGFVDLQSQLFLRHLVLQGKETVHWCGEAPDPNPRFEVETTPWSAAGMAARVPEMADLMLWNLESRVLGGEFILFAVFIGGVVAAAAWRGTSWRLPKSSFAVTATMAAVLLVSEFVLRWLVAPASPMAHALTGVHRLFAWLFVLAGVAVAMDGGVQQRVATMRPAWHDKRDARVLAIAVMVPWTVLVLLTVGLNRMIGIWPLQVLLMAAFLDGYRRTHTAASLRGWAMIALVVAVVFANSVLLKRTRNWMSEGWAGRSPDHIDAIEFRSVVCEDESH